ncbi:LamG-like jellyroll fold domain-containing protein [Acinetobacter sp. ANC 5502]
MAGIRLEFAQFGDFDSFDIIRSTSSMASIADVDLPSPVATGLKTMYWVDTNIINGETYYYRVRVLRNSIAKISNEIKAYVIANSSFIFRTQLLTNLVDDFSKVWTKYGAASFNDGLYLLNSGDVSTDYITTSRSNAAQIFSTNDFTMRLKVKLDKLTGVHIFVSCRNFGQGAGFWLGTIDGDLCFYTYNGTQTPAVGFQVPVSLSTTDFLNVSIERKNQRYYLYFNNILVANTTTATDIYAPTSTPIDGMVLGASSDDSRYFLQGYLKDFELISSALGNGSSATPNF